MENSCSPKKNSLGPILIGFALILLVFFLFFGKAYLQNKKNDKATETAREEETLKEESYNSVSRESLLKIVEAEKKDMIIDMRSPEEFKLEHIRDSINITSVDLEKALPLLKKEQTYFLIDTLGLTPDQKQALDIFKENGFEKVTFLEGGFLGWKNELFPTISSGNPYLLSDQAKVIYISCEELKKMAEEQKNIYLLDVREKNEYAQGRIKGAANIALADLEKDREKIPPFKKTIVYDNEGILAFQAAVRLFDLGITNVYTLSDGFKTWKEKGFEIEQ